MGYIEELKSGLADRLSGGNKMNTWRFGDSGQKQVYSGSVYDTSVMTPEGWQAFGASGGTVDGDKLMLGDQKLGELNTVDNAGGSTLGSVGAGLDIAGGLANAYIGYKNYGLQKDKFAFEKDMANKEYAMAKDAYDRNVKRAGSVGSQMQAGAVPSGSNVG
jgi:hypothetical protein